MARFKAIDLVHMQIGCENAARASHAAYWVAGHHDETAEMLCKHAFEGLSQAAQAIGYRLEKIEADGFAEAEKSKVSLNKTEAA